MSSMRRELIDRERMYELLSDAEGRYYLEVVCGGVGMYEVPVGDAMGHPFVAAHPPVTMNGGGHEMRHAFTLEYWQDQSWFVGRLKEVPGVFSQGESLAELEENIRDAYELVLSDAAPSPTPAGALSKLVEVEV